MTYILSMLISSTIKKKNSRCALYEEYYIQHRCYVCSFLRERLRFVVALRGVCDRED